jgi:hypothetical protein
MRVTLQGNWPEADFIPSSEVQRGRWRGLPRYLDPAKHGSKSVHQNRDGVNNEEVVKL